MYELKFTLAKRLSEEGNEKEFELARAVNDGKLHQVILTTNSLQIERDRKDERFISGVKGIKVIYQLSKGCLILMGHLGCSFRQPFGGEFVVTRAVVEEATDFNSISGVKEEFLFSNYPMSIANMEESLGKLVENKQFVYNLSQYDEFMELFEFYKALSTELNNNVTYHISQCSAPYYFVPISVKDIDVDDEQAIYNVSGVLAGYKIDDYKFEMLTSEQQDSILRLADISCLYLEILPPCPK